MGLFRKLGEKIDGAVDKAKESVEELKDKAESLKDKLGAFSVIYKDTEYRDLDGLLEVLENDGVITRSKDSEK